MSKSQGSKISFAADRARVENIPLVYGNQTHDAVWDIKKLRKRLQAAAFQSTRVERRQEAGFSLMASISVLMSSSKAMLALYHQICIEAARSEGFGLEIVQIRNTCGMVNHCTACQCVHSKANHFFCRAHTPAST